MAETCSASLYRTAPFGRTLPYMFALGRLVDHDIRNRAHEWLPVSVVMPRTVMWPHTAPVLNQGSIGSCTGHALAQLLNCAHMHAESGVAGFLTSEMAVELYSLATTLDPFPGKYPPEDTGSSGRAVCRAGKKLNYLTHYRWCFSLGGMINALQTQPVLVGTHWYTGMFTPVNGFLNPTGEIVGGHEYVVLGVNLEDNYFTILNSWGSGWGENGRARISFDIMRLLLGSRGDVVVPKVNRQGELPPHLRTGSVVSVA